LDSWVEWVFAMTGRTWVSHSITSPETVITPGWIYWIPFIAGFACVRRVGKWTAVWVALPFVLLLMIAVLYIDQDPPMVALAVQKVVPFMKYFRVATRWGLFLPQILCVAVVLCWPELTAWARRLFPLRSGPAWVWVGIFAASTLFESVAAMRAPVSSMPQLSDSATRLLQGVKEAPGTTVLDLPFCLAGGNGVCTPESCPNYPQSTVSGCFRGWHDKKVYGIYAARLIPAQCEYYHQAPYLSWFEAWRTQRCFTEAEWGDFCSYLDQHTELSAVLLYPDIWSGAGTPACLAQFERHLGGPLGQADFANGPVVGDGGAPMSRLIRFGTRCVSAKP
jgi:hypothetical protein